MPSTKPGSGGGDTGVLVQTLKLEASPTAPYTLTAVVPLPRESFPQYLAVRSVEDMGGNPTDWWYTETELIARTEFADYFEVKARIPSGNQTVFKLDRLDSPHHAPIRFQKPTMQGTPTDEIATFIDAHTWGLLNELNAVRLEVKVREPGGALTTHSIPLTGGYKVLQPGQVEGAPIVLDRVFSRPMLTSGWYRRGRLIRTLYKHLPIVPGGELGYLHIFATVMADTPEIQFEINWHNGGLEERRGPPSPGGGVTPGGESQLPGTGTNADVPALPFGRARIQDIVFSKVNVRGFAQIDPHPNYAGAWMWTPELQDGGSGPADSCMRTNQNELVKPVSDSDGNRQHVIPLTFERGFRFAVHPSSVTPYLKRGIAVCDWSKDLGGWMFTPLGLPDYTALGATAASMDLTAEATTCKNRLRLLLPWKNEDVREGLTPVSHLWPGSYGEYGGETAGVGMWPFYGSKMAWTAERDGLDILKVEQLRVRSRTYGALYYNLSGMPVIPLLHAPGGSGAWKHFDRRFTKDSGGLHDSPFEVTAAPRRVQFADYNPGPRQGFTPIDTQSEGTNTPQTPNVNQPDWYVPGEGPAGNPGYVTMDTLALGFMQLAHFNAQLGAVPPPGDLNPLPGSNAPDLAVPVVVQISGASTYNNTKSVTFRISGTGEFDIPLTEDVTIAGPSSNVPSIQARNTVGRFKTVSSIEITQIVGTLVSTELLGIGRASVGIADYSGSDAIIAIDDQHAIRYHATNKALFLLTNDPLAFLYLLADAADARLTYWELTGPAGRLPLVENGGPGHGNSMTRQWAWATDRICTGLALSEALTDHATVDALWDTWRQRFTSNILSSVMPGSGLFQAASGGKEMGFQPLGGGSLDFDSGNASRFFHNVPTRETAYFVYSLLMLSHIYGHDNSTLRTAIAGMARGFQDLLWRVSGGTRQGPHAYVPVAYRKEPVASINPRTGALEQRILMSTEIVRSTDVWVIFGSQADIPAENPISKCVLAPGSYPPVDDDLYVAALAGNAAALGAGSPTGAMSALTLLRNDANVAQQPTPLTMTVNGGATFTASKRRMFRITGTDPWGVPLDDDCLAAERAGDTITPSATITVLAHNFPVAARIGVTVLGGTTFSYISATNEGQVFFRIDGTSITGAPLSETLTCRGNGQARQFFRTQAFFKTITAIQVTQVNGTGGPFARLSTEKFRVGTEQPLMVVSGNGGATQVFTHWANYKTVSEIIMLTQTQATEAGFPNVGTLVVGETFRFGTASVGLQQAVPGGGIMDADAYQTAYALAVFKHLGAAEADELIKRHANVDGSQGGADTLLAAKNAIKTWNEYSGGPAGRLEQWAPLLWTLRNVS